MEKFYLLVNSDMKVVGFSGNAPRVWRDMMGNYPWCISFGKWSNDFKATIQESVSLAVRGQAKIVEMWLDKDRHVFSIQVEKLRVDRSLISSTYEEKPNHDVWQISIRELPIGVADLSPRELQILEMIGHDMSSKQISDSLRVAMKTVENTRKKLRDKVEINPYYLSALGAMAFR